MTIFIAVLGAIADIAQIISMFWPCLHDAPTWLPVILV
jgi:hypothetical protein